MSETQQGRITDESFIECACGRHLGKVTREGIELPRCPGCSKPVLVPVQLYRMFLADKLIDLVKSL